MKNKTVAQRLAWRASAVVLALTLALLSTAAGQAQAGPETMSFQERLFDSGGTPLTAAHCLCFRLCDDSVCSNQLRPGSGFE